MANIIWYSSISIEIKISALKLFQKNVSKSLLDGSWSVIISSLQPFQTTYKSHISMLSNLEGFGHFCAIFRSWKKYIYLNLGVLVHCALPLLFFITVITFGYFVCVCRFLIIWVVKKQKAVWSEEHQAYMQTFIRIFIEAYTASESWG